MRIIQITDLHIGNKDELPFGVDVRANFHRILEKAQKQSPDLIILSGDLCMHEGDREIYKWIYQHLQDMDIPFRVISGNHDRSDTMAQIFGMEAALHNDELYYEEKIDDKLVLFLDTAIGTMSRKQLDWVGERVSRDLLIFMHHPPIKASVPHMDRLYPLQNGDEFRRLFSDGEEITHVFCGHYHVAKSVYTDTLAVHITPSCFFQIDDREEDFKVAHHNIALRIIDWDEERLMTSVHYYPGVVHEE